MNKLDELMAHRAEIMAQLPKDPEAPLQDGRMARYSIADDTLHIGGRLTSADLSIPRKDAYELYEFLGDLFAPCPAPPMPPVRMRQLQSL